MNNLIIHTLIPARGGSKSIKKKNIKIYKDFPLLVHSIKLSKDIKIINKTVVSTDCNVTKEIAIKNGAEVPFLRPKNISCDLSTDYECFIHYIEWLKENKKQVPDIIIHLRPTYPERSKILLEDCIKKFIKNRNNYDSLRTVIPLEKSLFKMYLIDNKQLIPTYEKYKNINKPYNRPRQILPKTYLHNGCIDIINSNILNNGSITGNKIYPYIMNENETYDIDTEEDWNKSLIYK